MPRKAARDGLPGGQAGPVGMGGPGWAGRGHGWAARGHGWAARGSTHSPHTVAYGGNCTNRATTRRRHAAKQLLMLQTPQSPGKRARQEPNSPATMPGSGCNDRGHAS